ncbi:MAG: hypothetical protein DBX59_08680 [Bacillota bacterium]|nr:MAG: hypothetical protein DBX59_08680 [Bacillota bacterium]
MKNIVFYLPFWIIYNNSLYYYTTGGARRLAVFCFPPANIGYFLYSGNFPPKNSLFCCHLIFET